MAARCGEAARNTITPAHHPCEDADETKGPCRVYTVGIPFVGMFVRRTGDGGRVSSFVSDGRIFYETTPTTPQQMLPFPSFSTKHLSSHIDPSTTRETKELDNLKSSRYKRIRRLAYCRYTRPVRIPCAPSQEGGIVAESPDQ
jgi:hypothetical protein